MMSFLDCDFFFFSLNSFSRTGRQFPIVFFLSYWECETCFTIMGFHFLMMCQCKNPPWDQFLCTTNLYLWSDSYLDNLVWTKIIFFFIGVLALVIFENTFSFFCSPDQSFYAFSYHKIPCSSESMSASY